MKTLEAAHQTDFSKINFNERKISITSKYTLLYGPPRCGKTYLIMDYLSKFDTSNYLYIDFNDLRVDENEVIINLQEYIFEHNIEAIALENYNFQCKLPICNSIIISSNHIQKIDNFKSLLVMPLDFEEYILHYPKLQSTTNSFNTFLKYGNLPGLIDYSDEKKITRMQEIIKLYSKNQTQLEVLKILFKSLGEKRSIFQLYNQLKKSIKISKDMFYSLCDEYEKNCLIFFVQKYDQPKATKKLYAFNHTFLDCLSHQKNFTNEFSNMVYLELLKKKTDIYYLDKVDFYIPSKNKLILAIAFFNPLQIPKVSEILLPYIKHLNIKKVVIITIGIEQVFYCDNQEITAIPFYEWALGE
jgi:predicted AAA+ superfamily ATPase